MAAAQCAPTARHFSGWPPQIAEVPSKTRPDPRWAASSPQGAPAQKPAMLPSARVCSTCSGGITTRADVPIGVEARRRQPVAQQEIVGREGVHHRKARRGGLGAQPGAETPSGGQRIERRRTAPAPASAAARPMVTVLPPALRPIGTSRRARRPAQSQRRRQRQRRQHGGRVQHSIGQLVGDVGPGRLDRQLHLEPEFAEQPALYRHHGGRAVREPQQAESHRRADCSVHCLASSPSRSTCRAISTIFRPLVIALRRSHR